MKSLISFELGKLDIRQFLSSQQIVEDQLSSHKFKFLLESKGIAILNKTRFPELLLKFPSFQGSYVLKFNLEHYPWDAPTACLWDVKEERVPSTSKWPRVNPHCVRIFSPKWNRNALNIRWDRVAQSNRPHWHQTYIAEEWQDGDPLFEYVLEVAKALNDLK